MSLDDEIIFMRMISEYFHDEEKLCQPFKHKAKRNFIILLAKKKGNFMKGNFVWFLSSDASRVLVACYAPLFFLFLMPWIFLKLRKLFRLFALMNDWKDFAFSEKLLHRNCDATRRDWIRMFMKICGKQISSKKNSCWFFRLAW